MNDCGHVWEVNGQNHRCIRDLGHPGHHSTAGDPKMKSRYVIQTTDKSHCPKCTGLLDLLCHEWAGPQRERAFYICWNCRLVHEVGKGEVRRD